MPTEMSIPHPTNVRYYACLLAFVQERTISAYYYAYTLAYAAAAAVPAPSDLMLSCYWRSAQPV